MSYSSIRVSTLRGDQHIDFDIYVKINDKHILYLRQGDSFEGDRLKRLKEKKLKKMFILADHEARYRNYLQSNIEAAYDSKSTKSIENRSQIIQGAQQAHAEEVMDNPGDQFAYEQAKSGMSKFFEFLETEQKALAHILKIENMDQSIAHHGVTVASLSQSLAKALGMGDSKMNQLMGLGAMLHDLEHFNSSLVVARPLSQMTEAELKIYKEHPRLGAQKAADKKHFDQLVTQIIMQHEETVDGKGFPQGLVEAKIDPYALVVGCTNFVDRMISFEATPRQEVSKKLLITGLGKYPLGHLKALQGILNQNL